MNQFKVIDFYEDRSNLDEVARQMVIYLEQGGVVVYPTDTIYGLGCDALNEEAVQKIAEIKDREEGKAFSVIVRDLAMLKEYAKLPKRAEKIVKKILPGKFTVVLPLKDPGIFPEALLLGKEAIGIRIPDFDLTQKVSQDFKHPYVTTSVNEAGEKPEIWGVDIIKKYQYYSPAPDLVIDHGKLAGDSDEPEVSTVIDFTEEKPRVLRSGGMKLEEIMKLLEDIDK